VLYGTVRVHHHGTVGVLLLLYRTLQYYHIATVQYGTGYRYALLVPKMYIYSKYIYIYILHKVYGQHGRIVKKAYCMRYEIHACEVSYDK
jgi:hypothetical protein